MSWLPQWSINPMETQFKAIDPARTAFNAGTYCTFMTYKEDYASGPGPREASKAWTTAPHLISVMKVCIYHSSSGLDPGLL